MDPVLKEKQFKNILQQQARQSSSCVASIVCVCVCSCCDNSWLRDDKLLCVVIAVFGCASCGSATKQHTLETLLMAPAAPRSMFTLAWVTFTHRRLLIKNPSHDGDSVDLKKTKQNKTLQCLFHYCALFAFTLFSPSLAICCTALVINIVK